MSGVWRNAARVLGARLDRGEHNVPDDAARTPPDVAAGRDDPFTHGTQTGDGAALEGILRALSFRSEDHPRNDETIDNRHAGRALGSNTRPAIQRRSAGARRASGPSLTAVFDVAGARHCSPVSALPPEAAVARIRETVPRVRLSQAPRACR